jgi:hypothetical protein
LKFPLPKPCAPVPLDQLEEPRRPVLCKLGEDPQQVAVLVPVGEDTEFPQLIAFRASWTVTGTVTVMLFVKKRAREMGSVI